MVKKLTQHAVKKLRDRRTLRPSDRANLDYKMAKKLQSGLDELAGLLYIMNALPPEKIIPKKDKNGRKIGLKDRHIRLLFDLTESALRILDFKKIRGNANNIYILQEVNRKITGVDWQTGKAIKHGEFHRRKPLNEEIERAKLLWKHVDYLKKYFVPELNIESPSIVRSASLEDRIDEQLWEKEEIKIKELFLSGMGMEQIAIEVGCDSWGVWQTVYQIQENERETKRRTEQIAQDIKNLEQDTVAIERIKEFWGKGWRNKLALAVEINHSQNAVTHIIDKMIEWGEIAKEELVWISH